MVRVIDTVSLHAAAHFRWHMHCLRERLPQKQCVVIQDCDLEPLVLVMCPAFAHVDVDVNKLEHLEERRDAWQPSSLPSRLKM